MTTNPTPLTVGTVIDIIVYDLTGNIPRWDGGEAFVKAFCRSSITPDVHAIEAYAAQQNAELVAENERLKASVQLLDEQGNKLLKALEKEEKISATLQAENERLKQQLADQKTQHDRALLDSIKKVEAAKKGEVDAKEALKKVFHSLKALVDEIGSMPA